MLCYVINLLDDVNNYPRHLLRPCIQCCSVGRSRGSLQVGQTFHIAHAQRHVTSSSGQMHVYK